MKKFSLDFVTSIFFFLASSAWLGYTSTMPFSSSVTSFGGPATFPFLVLTIMVVCSGIATVSGYNKMRQGAGNVFPDMAAAYRVVLLFIIAAVHVAVIEFTGYVPATVFLILASLLLFGVRSKIMLISVSLAFPVLIYIVFERWLLVQLP